MASWLSAIWWASWQGALAISVVWLLCRLVKGIDPRVQSWLWRLVYLRIMVSLVWPHALELPLLPPAATVAISTSTNDGLLVPNPAREALAQPAALDPAQIILWILFAAWALGSLYSMRRLIREALDTRSLRNKCREVANPELAAEYASLACRLGIANPPALVASPDVFAPLIISANRSAIVIPDSFDVDYPAQQRSMILAHELTHFKRADLRWSWLARIVRCVFFFHPFVWLADHEWQQAQEMACDREVLLLELDTPASYGAALLRIVQQPSVLLAPGLAAMYVAESYSTVRRRLMAMNQSGFTSRRSIALTAAAALAASAVAFIPWRVVAQESKKAPNIGYANHEGVTFLNPELIKELQLSNVQIAKIKSIHETAGRQIRRTLTPQQAAGLDKMLAAGHEEKVHMSLTPQQMEKLDAIKREMGETAKTIESDASLTPEQKEQRMRRLKEEHEAAFSQILTPQQLEEARAAKTAKEVGSPELTEDQMHQMAELKRHLGELARRIEQDTAGNPDQKKRSMEEFERAKEEGLKQILRPDQLQQIEQEKTAHSAGAFSIDALAKLGLSPAQMRKVETIHRDAQRQFQAVLTPAQRAKLQQMHGK